MKALSIGVGGAALMLLAAGCQPKLAQVNLGQDEAQWNEFVSSSYSGYRPPQTTAPATKDKVIVETRLVEAVPIQEPLETITPEPAMEEPAAGESAAVVTELDEVVLEGPAPAADPGTEAVKQPAAKDAAAVQPEAVPAGKSVEYVVKPGDTLSFIAKKFYKDGRKIGPILKANKGTISNPNALRPGMKLAIPQE